MLGFDGAAFPWRTIHGEECSGYWPAGTAAVHVTADIAIALARYTTITGDESIEREGGVELLIETARFWMSVGHFGHDGKWHISGVTGPDEYTALVDDNTYTNLAAAENLAAAADAVERHADIAHEHGVTSSDINAWRRAADSVFIPYNKQLRIHEQNAGFTMLPEWDFEGSRDKYPLLLNAPYFDIYRKQVVKQADLVLALTSFGRSFDDEHKARAVDYYERRTVRDSSLSASVQAVACAEGGHLELAYDYAYEAALIDLQDLHHNSRDGLHIASLAGAWVALVKGFGGMRDTEGELAFNPALPSDISRLTFTVRWRKLRLRVDITATEATYTLRDGPDASLTLRHAGEPLTVRVGEPITAKIAHRKPLLPRPRQPVGREPIEHTSAPS
jgi:trehalose/maltose hydrolase-like predicted phosphorylase